jgi:hypothetical protein
MTRAETARLVAMFLAGPLVWVGAAMISESGAMIGWSIGGVLVLWASALLFRRLPPRYCIRAAIAAVPLALMGALLHNLVYGLTGAEEPVFFLLALAVAPAMLIGGLLGLMLHVLWPTDGHGLQPS